MEGPAVEIDDPAALAFEGVRAEVALLRRAVEGLAAERVEIEVPDYAPTLAQIAQSVRATSTRLDRMSEAPALAIGPEEMTSQIAAAGTSARREDHAALVRAQAALDQATGQLASRLSSARKRREQTRWVVAFTAGGFFLGMLLWVALPGWIARSVAPESWRWPEQRAARALGLPMWLAGLRLLATADPTAFRAIAAADKLVTANRDPIRRCDDRLCLGFGV